MSSQKQECILPFRPTWQRCVCANRLWITHTSTLGVTELRFCSAEIFHLLLLLQSPMESADWFCVWFSVRERAVVFRFSVLRVTYLLVLGCESGFANCDRQTFAGGRKEGKPQSHAARKRKLIYCFAVALLRHNDS